MIYGYLSSRENIQQLKEFGISEQNIYVAREELFNATKSGDIIVLLISRRLLPSSSILLKTIISPDFVALKSSSLAT